MADDTKTWEMVHAERAKLADLFETLTPEQWARSSLCDGWTAHILAAHILAGAEQTKSAFLKGMAANGFRFNTMIDRDARQLSELTPAEITQRLRATTTTTNGPPAPVVTVLGEAVVHGEDLRQPLGLPWSVGDDTAIACLEMYKKAAFPIGSKKRVRGLRLVATDVDWSYGEGPEVSGPTLALLLAMTGRAPGLENLTGDGVPIMRARLAA